MLRDIVAARHPDIPVSLSSDILPEFRNESSSGTCPSGRSDLVEQERQPGLKVAVGHGYAAVVPVLEVPAGGVGGLLDLTRISPPVLLTADGFYDRRALDQMIPWSDIAEAYAWRGGYTGIRLRLRRSVNARHNPFRIGTAFIAWRRRPDELYVPVRFLTVRPHPLVHCIAALVRRHGGSVEIEPPWFTIKPPRR